MNIKDIIKEAGGVTQVAKTCGIKPQAVSQWTQVPVARVQALVSLCSNRYSANDIRPDIFPPDKAA